MFIVYCFCHRLIIQFIGLLIMDGVGFRGFGKGNGNHVVIKYCNVEGLGYVVGVHNC